MMNRLPCCCFIVIMLFAVSPAMSENPGTAREPGSEKIPSIMRMAMETQDRESLLRHMTALADIGDENAAAAFAEIVRHKVFPSGLRVTPFISRASDFNAGKGVREELSPMLEDIFEAETGRLDRILAAGALARYGDRRCLDYLLDEYRKSESVQTREEEHFRDSIFRALCKVIHPDASRLIAVEVRENSGIVLRLTAIQTMLRAGNPAALTVARENISVGSGDFDGIEARIYLEAIARFGDHRDRKFLDDIVGVWEPMFGKPAEKRFGQLLKQAYAKVGKAEAADDLTKITDEKPDDPESPGDYEKNKSESGSGSKTNKKSDKRENALKTSVPDPREEKPRKEEVTNKFVIIFVIVIVVILSVVWLIIRRKSRP